MKHNRFERVDKQSKYWFKDKNDKYKIHCDKRLHSIRLLKQDSIKYDTREPAIRYKAKYDVLETLVWWERPDRYYSRSWKYRSRFPKQYMKNRRK